MPVTTSAQQIPAIVQWFQIYGNVVFFFAQLLWWIVTGFAAGWAACIFYRLAKAKIKMYEAKAAGHGEIAAENTDDKASDDAEDAKDAKDEDEKDTKDKVDVDKFVE
jgi:phosphate/sulfate permease